MRDTPRLGRGLAALLGDSLQATQPDDRQSTPIDDLESGPFQPRSDIDDSSLAELAASIREQGLLQPILIRRHPAKPDRYQIIAGERRWRAARLAGLTVVATFQRDLSDDAASVAALVENLQRVDLNAIEEAEGLRRLSLNYGLTQESLAQAIGKSRSHVANTLRLLQLPDEVIQHVRNGALTAGHARAALACADPLTAAQTMVDRGLSVRQAEALSAPRSSAKIREAGSNERQTSIDVAAVERDLTEQLGLAVSISFNGQSGSISLRYRSLDQLDYIVAKLGRP